MEVHAHTHTARKKWTHYLWEFLMLFLAVFCGFLAENQREHLVEHRREKGYMKSLKEDVDADILQINVKLQPTLTAFLAQLDSLIAGFERSEQGSVSLATLRELEKGTGFPDFIYNDRTISQLKNAGNMRLIRKTQVADSISAYDATVRRGMVHQDLLNHLYMPRINDRINYMIDLGRMKRVLKETATEATPGRIVKDILLTSDRTEIARLVNEFTSYREDITWQIIFINRIKVQAERLSALLKQEYHLQ